MLLWQAYENRLKFFITYILSNTRFLIRTKRLAFILALAMRLDYFTNVPKNANR